jgi:hypothetical protein
LELALILPVLLALCFGAVEMSHAILFNNILLNMSREGANLASRTTQSPQFIIDALNHTSAPLEMEAHGMIFISRVTGMNGGSGLVVPVLDEQYRAVLGDSALLSRLWQCPHWDVTGNCTLPPAMVWRMAAAMSDSGYTLATGTNSLPLATSGAISFSSAGILLLN